ncbi:MAG: hypothetical protein KDD94_04810 [Calditrichaeota bacterium]|nr:hypothetical protein [Calditrichota bacterium]
MFHRRLFPDDVDGTVAFVAPLTFEEEDSRFITYLNTVGDMDCRDKLKNYQRKMLENIDAMPPLFTSYVNFVNTTYNVDFNYSLSYQSVVKHGMLDFPFEFYSSYLGCEDIPDTSATNQQLFDFFVNVVDIFLYYSDYGIDFWTPYFYQTRIELGDYYYDTSYIDDLLGEVSDDLDFGFDFGTTTFNPAAMQDIDNWVKTGASDMIFIYGSDDPWTVAAVDIGANSNVQKFIAAGLKHDAYIDDLPPADQQFIRTKLSEWLNWYSFLQ